MKPNPRKKERIKLDLCQQTVVLEFHKKGTCDNMKKRSKTAYNITTNQNDYIADTSKISTNNLRGQLNNHDRNYIKR